MKQKSKYLLLFIFMAVMGASIPIYVAFLWATGALHEQEAGRYLLIYKGHTWSFPYQNVNSYGAQYIQFITKDGMPVKVTGDYMLIKAGPEVSPEELNELRRIYTQGTTE